MSWCTTPISLRYSNDLQLEVQKTCQYLKNVSSDFVLLILKLCPIQVNISFLLWIKLTMGRLLLFFLCNFSSFFQLRWRYFCNQPFFTVIDWTVCFDYSANNSIQGAFAILSLICSDLLNFLRRLGAMIIATEKG